ncbi:antitoxin [Jatrophihabitans sp. YIM 134969]
MSLLDKARRYAQKNPQGVERGVGKAVDAVNKRTGGKHAGVLGNLKRNIRKVTGGGGTERRGY